MRWVRHRSGEADHTIGTSVRGQDQKRADQKKIFRPESEEFLVQDLFMGGEGQTASLNARRWVRTSVMIGMESLSKAWKPYKKHRMILQSIIEVSWTTFGTIWTTCPDRSDVYVETENHELLMGK